MKFLNHYVKSVITVQAVITLFACEGNYKNVQRLSLKDGAPVSEGIDVNLFYTDSGKVVTNIITPKLLDFSNLEYTYQEFPEGVEVHFFEKDKKSIIVSDYAIRFTETGIVDLRENVVLTTADGTVLKAQQLYWDQKNKWVFTDQPYRISFNDGSYNDGSRFDANEDFTVFLSRDNDGVQIVDKTDTKQSNNDGQ